MSASNKPNKAALEFAAPLSPDELRVGCERDRLPIDRTLVTLANPDNWCMISRPGSSPTECDWIFMPGKLNNNTKPWEIAGAALQSLADPAHPFTGDIINSYDAVVARNEQMSRNTDWLLAAFRVIHQCLCKSVKLPEHGGWQVQVKNAVRGARSAERLLDTMRQERQRTPAQSQQDVTDLKRYEAGLFLATIHDMVFGEFETKTDAELLQVLRQVVEAMRLVREEQENFETVDDQE